jgi:hypothetical protein
MRIHLILAVLVTIFVSCNNSDNKKPTAEQKKADLDSLRALKLRTLKDAAGANKDLLMKLDSGYGYYVSTYAEDSLVPLMYFERAKLNLQYLQNAQSSIPYFSYVVDSFPSHEKAEESLYFLGIIHETVLKKPTIALKYFKAYLEKYPEGEHSSYLRLYIERMHPYIGDIDATKKQ